MKISLHVSKEELEWLDSKPLWLADYVDRTLCLNNENDDGEVLTPDIQVIVDGVVVIESYRGLV